MSYTNTLHKAFKGNRHNARPVYLFLFVCIDDINKGAYLTPKSIIFFLKVVLDPQRWY